MGDLYLELTGETGTAARYDLVKSNPRINIKEMIDTESYVISDLYYSIAVKGLDDTKYRSVRLLVNDEEKASYAHEGVFYFSSKGTFRKRERIFEDCYGFINFTVLITDENEEQYFYSKYLSVLVRRGENNDAVKKMVRYVNQNNSDLLQKNITRPSHISELKAGGTQNTETRIMLASDIASIYESSYGYFKANSRYKAVQTECVDRIEKLQYVTPGSMQFMARNPQYLKRSLNDTGIRFGRSSYAPERTLTSQISLTTDIYENRLIVSFISVLLRSLSQTKAEIETMICGIPDKEEFNTEYVYSSYIIYESTKGILDKEIHEIVELIVRFQRIYSMYRDILPVTEIECATMPQSTAILLSVPQYRRVFNAIHGWFSLGTYDFGKEKFMLSFIRVADLYECYLATRMISALKEKGFELLESRCIQYSQSGLISATDPQCCNAFVFSKGQITVTLYCQPIIYNHDMSSYYGIELYRNTTISMSEGSGIGRRGDYYNPDYIIKISDEEKNNYIIMDAKYSQVSSVKDHYVSALAYKYLFSVSPVSEMAELKGLCIIYGRTKDGDHCESVYDNQIEGQRISPFFDLIPFSEEMDEKKLKGVTDQLFQFLNN